MNFSKLFSELAHPLIFFKKIIIRLKNKYKMLHAQKIFFFKQSPTTQINLKNINPQHFFNLKDAWSTSFKKQIVSNTENTSLITPPEWQNQFSFKIPLRENTNSNIEIFDGDIKTSWEHARFAHLLWAGFDFEKDPITNKHLQNDFFAEIATWQEQNPYLHGICWMNAMEVSIRAINLLWLFNFFYTKPQAPHEELFWQNYLNSLFAHATFIQNYWEDYDKPNNHYLLNLTGAWYLALFFEKLDIFPFGSRDALWQKVCVGFDLQLQSDGTLYEGSTNYHKLVMQSLQHLSLLNKNNNFSFPEGLKGKFTRGIQFLADSKNTPTSIVQIGDNDSSFIVAPINLMLISDANAEKKMQIPAHVKEYSDFGIVFIINQHWHISFRTKSFDSYNPTGHFHADLLGITVTFNSESIIVDPGTGCYTGNRLTRNYLRSWQSHSTFYASNNSALNFSSLFKIDGSYLTPAPILINTGTNTTTVTAQYEYRKISYTRSLKLDVLRNIFSITDTVQSKNVQTEPETSSNLIFSPEIQITKKDTNFFELNGKNCNLILKTTASNVVIKEGLYSKEYGHLERCPKFSWSPNKIKQTTTLIYPK
jgi:hypothetical protein